MAKRIGIVGARGHVGSELIRLLDAHPKFELEFVSSRQREGEKLCAHEPGYSGELRYVSLAPDAAAHSDADALVLALPNGHAAPYVAAVNARGKSMAVLDLSADYRFDAHWHYGLPELNRKGATDARRISNPGCYATAMQLAIAPMLGELAGPVQCFGVSGYSGAGTTPSERNDPEKLRDNLMPYALTGHVHEREASAHLGHAIEFMPHVAPHFRGLSVTVNMHLDTPLSQDEALQRYRTHYASEPLVDVTADPPWVSRLAGAHGVQLGGFSVSDAGDRLVVVAALDNLLKGAATQALQNLNLAFGFDELEGIVHFSSPLEAQP